MLSDSQGLRYPWTPQEFTSVTKLPRRIGRFDWKLAKRAVEVNRPTRLALTGLDYIDFHSYGLTDLYDLSDRARIFVEELFDQLRVPVGYLSSSPRLKHTFFVSSVAAPERQTKVFEHL